MSSAPCPATTTARSAPSCRPLASCSFEETFFVEPDEVADPPQDTLPHVNTFTACILPAGQDQPITDPAILLPGDDPAEVGFVAQRLRPHAVAATHGHARPDRDLAAAADPGMGAAT